MDCMPRTQVLSGVDGCREGWIAVIDDGGRLEARVFPTWSAFIAAVPKTTIIGVDIPIGLPEVGPRQCDLAARKRLGQPRGSSVFPAPVRGVLRAGSYRELSKLHQEFDGRKLTQQTFRLLPKIAQVDLYLKADPSRQAFVIEVHPEVSFSMWNGRQPMNFRKSKTAGRLERELLIDREWPGVREQLWKSVQAHDCERDDLNDAFAALWTVRRVAAKTAERLPPRPEVDVTGVRMEITA